MSAYRTRSQMFPVIEHFLSSGLSQAAYSRQESLHQATLSYWLKKYRSAAVDEDRAKNGTQFVAIAPLDSQLELVVELPGGIRLIPNGLDEQSLISLLTKLSRSYA